MKKINLAVGFLFLSFAIAFTINVSVVFSKGEALRLSQVITTIAWYILAIIYLRLGFTTEKRQKERMAELSERYQTLMEIYEEISDPANAKDKLLRKVFVNGVQDFEERVFCICNSTYPREMKEQAENMLNDLRKKQKKCINLKFLLRRS